MESLNRIDVCDCKRELSSVTLAERLRKKTVSTSCGKHSIA